MAAAPDSFWVWAVAENSVNPAGAAQYCAWMTSPEVEKRKPWRDQQTNAINAPSNDREVLAKVPFLLALMEQLANGKIDPPFDFPGRSGSHLALYAIVSSKTY